MFKNYLKIAARNLLKHKGYSFINILGLAVGIAASVLITLYVLDELRYDRFHEKADRIYRITADWSNKGDSKIHQLGTPSVLARTIRDKYPQAEAVTQLCGPLGDWVIKYGEIGLKETEVYGAEPSFFETFTFPLIKGDPATALADPDCVVLSQSLASKCFRDEDPLGRTLDLGSGTALLAIAAGRLGAAPVFASDNDPEATRSSSHHAHINGVRLGVVRADGGRGLRSGSFDLVVANLMALLLVDRSTEIRSLLAPGGALVLSGLLVDDLPFVREAFGACGPPAVRLDGEWGALVYESVR